MKKTGSVLLIVLLFVLSSLSAQKVVLGSLDWEPYIGQNLKNMGYVAELTKAAFEAEGLTMEVKYYPWARTIKMAKSGSLAGYFPEYYSKES